MFVGWIRLTERGQLPYRFGQSFSIHTFYNIWLRQIIAFICFYKTPYCLYHFIAISPWDIIYRHEYTAKSQIYTKILNKKNRIQNTKLQNSIGFDKCSALDLIFYVHRFYYTDISYKKVFIVENVVNHLQSDEISNEKK